MLIIILLLELINKEFHLIYIVKLIEFILDISNPYVIKVASVFLDVPVYWQTYFHDPASISMEGILVFNKHLTFSYKITSFSPRRIKIISPIFLA